MILRRALVTTGVVGALLAAASPLRAQDARVGVSVVGTAAAFDGPPTIDFDRRTGGGVGLFADVATPWRPLDVRVEGRWLRRGGDRVGGGGAEMDLLSVPLALGLRLALGPVSLMPHAGFEMAYPLAVRTSPEIDVGFGESARADAAGFAGIALDVEAGSTWRIGVEGRLVRGLAAAFEGPAGRLESRAVELAVRLSRPAG